MVEAGSSQPKLFEVFGRYQCQALGILRATAVINIIIMIITNDPVFEK